MQELTAFEWFGLGMLVMGIMVFGLVAGKIYVDDTIKRTKREMEQERNEMARELRRKIREEWKFIVVTVKQ